MKEQPVIVFCLPGSSYSGRFLQCWTQLIAELHAVGIKYYISQKTSCNIYYVRNMCLGGDVQRGVKQIPFDAEIQYTHTMWIDSDIVFKPSDLFRLLEHDKDIVSGIYKMENGIEYAAVINWDEEFFKQHSHFEFLTDEGIRDAQKQQGLIKADYTGFGWILVKKSVFVRIDYPWFSAINKQIGNMVDFTMEDVAFCHKAKALGYDIWIDPTIKVGHEKTKVLT